MPFPTNLVPTELRCPECGHYIKDIRLSEGFEHLVATTLKAKVAQERNEGFDVYDSTIFPDTTFQAKYARAREGRKIQKIVEGRDTTWDASPTWTWNEPIALGADIYVLFGIKEDSVYPFIVPVDIWEDESYNDGRDGRILRISTDSHSHCGRYRSSYKRNKFWQYQIKQWPKGLLEVIEYYRTHKSVVQSALPLLVEVQ